MSLGQISLKLTLSDEEFKSSMNKAVDQVKNSVNLMKNIFIAAQLGSYLFSGASQQAQEELKQVQTAMSAMAEGFSVEMIKNLQPIVDMVDFLGVGADQAADILYKFVLTGKAMGLQQMGVYLDKDTQSMLSAMSAAERYNWALKNIPQNVQKVYNALSPTTKAFYEFKKRADDVKKSLGTSFTSVLLGIVNAFGGVNNAMKIAIIAFTAYKTATILGNVGIGISKAIAMASVWSAPAAIAMGAAALASISALIGGAAIAVNAIDNVPNIENSFDSTASQATQNNENKQETIVIIKDRFGETQETISQKNGVNSNVQTKY